MGKNHLINIRTTNLLRGIAAAVLVLLICVASARAQEGTSITIDAVDDSGFPEVVVDLTVTGAQGGAVTGLTAADFHLFEDGIRVPANSLMVSPRETGVGNLVVAVDVSTEPENLARIREGLLALIDQLGPSDQVTLLSFFDDVRLEQAATTDKAALRAAVQGLAAGGDFTALYRATIEAINRAELLSAGRKAVVIVTDSIENANTIPAADVIARAQAVQVPLYIVAFGERVQTPGTLDQFAQQIGARAFIVGTPAEAQLRVQTLAGLLQGSGYRLRYLSSLPADGAEHTLSINLANGSAAGRADAIVRAVPGTVQVELDNLSNGQEVGGTVDLVPSIVAPGPVQRVEYLIDGEQIAVLTEPPFLFRWDSTQVAPGSHVVGVRVEDRAGNRGEVYVTVQVADPLQINAGPTRERLYLGDEITLVADVQSLQPVERVVFAVNGTPVGEVTAPPYRLTIDSNELDEGVQTVSVQAIDASGYTESTQFSIELTPRPPRFLFSGAVWLRILAVASIALTLILAWLSIIYLSSWARRLRQAYFRLELINSGNVASSYLLRADDARGALSFQFLLDGLPLRGRQKTEWIPVPQKQRQALPPRRSLRPRRAAAAPDQRPPSAGGQAANLGVQAADVQTRATDLQAQASGQLGKARQFAEKTTALQFILLPLINVLAGLSYLLPASLGGNALGKVTGQARSLYTTTSRVSQVNRSLDQTGEALSKQRGAAAQPAQQMQAQMQAQAADSPAAQQALAGMGGGQQSGGPSGGGGSAQQGSTQPKGAQSGGGDQGLTQLPALPAPTGWEAQGGNGEQPDAATTNGRAAYPHPSVNGQTPADENVRYASDGRAYQRVTRRVLDSNWTETPEVEPGDTLLLELVIEPKQMPRRTRMHPFRLSSKAVAEPGMPLHAQESTVKIQGVSWLTWLGLPVLIVLAAAAIVLFMVLFLLTDLGLISLSTLIEGWPLAIGG